MLKLTDLTVSKELDRKAMSKVTGGHGLGILPLDFSTRYDFMSGYQPSAAAATTGPQTIAQGLDDRDIAVAGDGGIAFNYSNNSQSAYNTAAATSASVPIAVKF